VAAEQMSLQEWLVPRRIQQNMRATVTTETTLRRTHLEKDEVTARAHRMHLHLNPQHGKPQK